MPFLQVDFAWSLYRFWDVFLGAFMMFFHALLGHGANLRNLGF
jgi:hypothetical protein